MNTAPSMFPYGLSMDQVLAAYQTFFATQTGYSVSQSATDNRAAPQAPLVNPPKRAPRMRLSPEQTKALTEKLAQNPTIYSKDAKELGAKIGMTEKQITNWFSYQRRKSRKIEDKKVDGC